MFRQKLRPYPGGQQSAIAVSPLPEPTPAKKKRMEHFPAVEMALWGERAWSQREHLVLVRQLKRTEGSPHVSYFEKERIMTEERRNRESRQGKQNIRGSDKAVNVGQVM